GQGSRGDAQGVRRAWRADARHSLRIGGEIIFRVVYVSRNVSDTENYFAVYNERRGTDRLLRIGRGTHGSGRESLLLLSRLAAQTAQLHSPRKAVRGESTFRVRRRGHRLRLVHPLPQATPSAGRRGRRDRPGATDAG